MAATRRLQKELQDLRNAGLKAFRDIQVQLTKLTGFLHMNWYCCNYFCYYPQVDEANILNWQGLLVPDSAPFNKGAFKIEIQFPAEYPFKPPKLVFKVGPNRIT